MTTVYQAEVYRIVQDLDPLVRKLHVRGKIPESARVETLVDAHISAVLKLHKEFSCPIRIARLRLTGAAPWGNYCRSRSAVLTVDKRVVGVFLVQADTSSEVAFIYGVVIAKRLRGTWANAFLKLNAFRRLSASGVLSIRCQAEEASQDTHKHAVRVGAVVLARHEGEAPEAAQRLQELRASPMLNHLQSSPNKPRADLTKKGFTFFPSLITPSLAKELYDATLVYPSRRVICGERATSFTERILDANCGLMAFFSSKIILNLLKSCTGRLPSEVDTIRAWTSTYSIGEFINAHRDSGGHIQLILGLRSAGQENGGALHLSYRGNDETVFLTPGDAIVFLATEVDHWTTPLAPTGDNPLPERVVGVARYYYK